MRTIANIFWLGTKELRSFLRDFVLVALVIYAFSLAVIAQAQSNSQELHNASIAFVDEDHSELSRRIIRAFLPPYFQTPQPIAERDIIPLMNAGRYTFVIDIPPNFERDVLGGRDPAIQVNVDATAMVQAGLGSGYAQQIITTEIQDFLSHQEGAPLSPVNLDVRIAFNPNIDTAWFTSVMGIINNVTMLAIILAGAAIVREREHGTMDHLLVMPLTPFEIAMSKVWANGLVITIAVGLSLYLVVRTVLGIPIAGSIPLFMLGVVIYLFFACAIGIFLGTVARTMPQLGLLFMLIFLPMNMLSGSNTPLESMPPWLATVMQASPSTHFVSFAQAILYRGAGIRRGLAAISLRGDRRRRVFRARHSALPLDLRADDLTIVARHRYVKRIFSLTSHRTKGVPPPPHPQLRREPLPWHRPKPAEEDPGAPRAVQAIRQSSTYRLAEQDADFIARADIRGPRLEIEYLKADVILAEQHIDHTIVVFGSTRIPEPAAARRNVEALRATAAFRSGQYRVALSAGDSRTDPRQKPLLRRGTGVRAADRKSGARRADDPKSWSSPEAGRD